MVAIVVPLATGQETLTALSLVATAGKAVLFFVIVTVIGIWIFPRSHATWLQRFPMLQHLSLRTYLTFDRGRYATLAILLAALAVGLLAHYFGFHPAIGAYMAGLIVREEHFQLNQQRINRYGQPVESNVFAETKRIVDNAAFCWIGPVFFVDLGAKILCRKPDDRIGHARARPRRRRPPSIGCTARVRDICLAHGSLRFTSLDKQSHPRAIRSLRCPQGLRFKQGPRVGS